MILVAAALTCALIWVASVMANRPEPKRVPVRVERRRDHRR